MQEELLQNIREMIGAPVARLRKKVIMITLSIIIVNYKSWEHLSICLDSIQNQKKINPEIIV